MNKICCVCRKDYVGKKTSKYCSSFCQRKRIRTPEERLKISNTKVIYKALVFNCRFCSNDFKWRPVKHYPVRYYCSGMCKNKDAKNRKPFWSEEQRKKMAERHIGLLNPSWRGGVASWRSMLNPLHKVWRKAVFERDGYTCVQCGSGGYVEADHIKPFAYYPDIRWDISNGQTLCRSCHHKKTSAEGKLYWKNQFTSSSFWKNPTA